MMTIYGDTLHWPGSTPILTLLLITDMDLITEFDFLPFYTWSCPIWDLQMFFCWDHWRSIIHYTTNSWFFTWFDFLPNMPHFLDLTPPFHVPFPGFYFLLNLIWLNIDMTEYRFLWDFCNGCGMLTGDAYSSGHLVLSNFGTCKCSNVETNLSWTFLVSGLLGFEHPSVLLFCP